MRAGWFVGAYRKFPLESSNGNIGSLYGGVQILLIAEGLEDLLISHSFPT